MSPPRPRSRARARRDETPLGKRGLDTLHGVGPRITERLAAIGIRSVEDLLFHLPLRYQDRTRVHPIGSLRAGEEVLIRAEVQLTQVRYGRRRSLVCMVADGTGSLTLRFFHFTQRQREGLARGAPVSCFGEVRQGPQGLEMVHSEYRVAADDAPVAVAESLTPVYPTTEGLTQRMLASLTDQALAALERGAVLEELLPEVTLGELRLPRLDEALCGVHRPPPETRTDALLEGTHPWQRRLAFEELLAHHLSLRALRAELDGDAAPRIEAGGELVARFLDGLGFELTGAQLRVAGEIATDLARDRPMHRLAQGDVGCGKTVVAALAILAAVEADHQAALMAPTELLA